MEYLTAKDTWNRSQFLDLSTAVTRTETPSQNGEGGLVNAIFEKCLPTNKWCFEVGADNGYNLSNTWYLINKQGWSAVLCENDPVKVPLLLARYEHNPKVHLTTETLAKDGLDMLLGRFDAPKDIDMISIDIDSYDDEVWEHLTVYRPHLVLIENDPFEHDVNVISHTWPMRDDGRVGGASVGRLNQIAKAKGYDFLCVQICTTFYIAREFAGPIRI